MAASTFTTAPDNTRPSTAYPWMHAISAFMATAGWKQQPDTGQLVYPASIINITDANGNGTTVTFTYTLVQGAALRVGSQIRIFGTTNFGTDATPITFKILTLPLGNTFTAASATVAHDTPAANVSFGGVNVLVTITDGTGNGASNTYHYTNTDGVLVPGQSITIPQTGTSGFVAAGLNGTFTVASINTGAGTFTTTTGVTQSIETLTVTGTVVANSVAATKTAATLSPTNGNVVYEIWGMGDALQATNPVLLRLEFTTGSNGAGSPGFNIQLGASTNGAGTISVSGSTAVLPVFQANNATFSASAFNSYISGSTNRILCSFWGSAVFATAARSYFSVERAHDAGGNDLGTYATLIIVSGGSSVATSQQSIAGPTQTVAETRLACLMVHSTGTGSFGSSTILSPVFPIVGAVGNPMINTFIGKAVDWVDGTNFSFTIYNSAHNYQVKNDTSIISTAGTLTYDSTDTCALIFRFD